jgi:hypothetical protein
VEGTFGFFKETKAEASKSIIVKESFSVSYKMFSTVLRELVSFTWFDVTVDNVHFMDELKNLTDFHTKV